MNDIILSRYPWKHIINFNILYREYDSMHDDDFDTNAKELQDRLKWYTVYGYKKRVLYKANKKAKS